MLPVDAARSTSSIGRLRHQSFARRFAALALVFVLTTGGHAIAKSSEACPSDHQLESLKTSQGVVTVEREVDEPWSPRMVAVGGKTVYTSEDSYVSLCKAYGLERGVAVLFRSNPGGLNIDHYHLPLLRKSVRPRVVTSKDFYSLASEIEVETMSGALHVDLGFEQNLHKTATLRHGILNIESDKPNRVVPLKANVCSGLHDVLSDCADRGARHLGCDAFKGDYYEVGLSAGAMSWITGLKQHPGFGSKAFGEACLRACTTSELPGPSAFRQSVCSISR